MAWIVTYLTFNTYVDPRLQSHTLSLIHILMKTYMQYFFEIYHKSKAKLRTNAFQSECAARVKMEAT